MIKGRKEEEGVCVYVCVCLWLCVWRGKDGGEYGWSKWHINGGEVVMVIMVRAFVSVVPWVVCVVCGGMA